MFCFTTDRKWKDIYYHRRSWTLCGSWNHSSDTFIHLSVLRTGCYTAHKYLSVFNNCTIPLSHHTFCDYFSFERYDWKSMLYSLFWPTTPLWPFVHKQQRRQPLNKIVVWYLQNKDYEFTTHVSYLEIYNENGYDLLDPKHEASKLEDLP